MKLKNEVDVQNQFATEIDTSAPLRKAFIAIALPSSY